MNPINDHEFLLNIFGFRPGKKVPDTAKQTQEHIQQVTAR